MRAAIVSVWLVAGCGRVGFGAHPAADGNEGAVIPDAAVPIGDACTVDADCGRCARCNGVCQVEPITDLALGHRSLCYIGASGSRWCAGENLSADLGLGDTDPHYLPARNVGEDGWTKFAVAYQQAIGLRQGELWRWPDSGTRLPYDDGVAESSVASIGSEDGETCVGNVDGTNDCDPSGMTWLQLAGADTHFCAIAPDGSMWCAGSENQGDLGHGVEPDGTVLAPTRVGTDTDWIGVSVGEPTSCGLKSGGTIYCWGFYGYAGTNGVDPMGVPLQVGNDTDWMKIESNYNKTCATKTDGSTWCWGSDDNGGYIAPDVTDAPVPILVGTYDRFVIGGHGACAESAGRWQCYGWNAAGQLGVGNTDAYTGFVELCP